MAPMQHRIPTQPGLQVWDPAGFRQQTRWVVCSWTDNYAALRKRDCIPNAKPKVRTKWNKGELRQMVGQGEGRCRQSM